MLIDGLHPFWDEHTHWVDALYDAAESTRSKAAIQFFNEWYTCIVENAPTDSWVGHACIIDFTRTHG